MNKTLIGKKHTGNSYLVHETLYLIIIMIIIDILFWTISVIFTA